MDSVRGMKYSPNVPEGEGYLDIYFILNKKFKDTSASIINSAENVNFIQKNNLFKGNTVLYLKGKTTIGRTKTLSNDMAGNFTFCDGVVYTMIASAIYMGFKEIYLAGADYTFYPVQSGHFYDDWVKHDYHDVDHNHYRVKEFADQQGVAIYNITPDNLESPVYRKVGREILDQIL